MAWRLRSEIDGSTLYLVVNKEFTVGRKDADLLISKDQSISRKHAIINVSYMESMIKNPEKIPIVTVKDANSKYGSLVNGTQMTNEDQVLKSGDILTFGQCGSIYSLIYEPLVVTTSCVESTDKIILKNAIRTLGGHLVPEWRTECTHLVMTEVKVTIKAACAMVALKPLVTIQYFAELVTKCNTDERPDPKNYIPKLEEVALDQENVTFDIVPERKTVFNGKYFIFLMTSQYKKLNLAITLSGAVATLVDKKNAERFREIFLKSNVCVIHPSSVNSCDNETKEYYNKVETILKSHNKRLIPESDIGLAVVHCSTEHYCNPDYYPGDSATCYGKLHSQTLSQNAIYAMETQQSEEQTKEIPIKAIINVPAKKMCEPIEMTTTSDLHQPDSSTVLETRKKDEREIEVSRSKRKSSSTNIDETQTKLSKIDSLPSKSIDKGLPIGLLIKNEPLSQAPMEVVETQPLISNIIKREYLETQNLDSEKQSEEFITDSIVTIREPRTSTQIAPPGFILSTQPPNDRIKSDNMDMENIKCNLMKIKFVSLIKIREKIIRREPQNNGIKNFKNFKKVLFASGNRLPRIIGGKDLIPFRKDENNKWGNEDAENRIFNNNTENSELF